jgi:hypothetical protein
MLSFLISSFVGIERVDGVRGIERKGVYSPVKNKPVIPAKAGIPSHKHKTPAYAGVTIIGWI